MQSARGVNKVKLQIVVFGLALAFTSSSSALTLDDLAAGTSFSAGALTFGHFAITATGSVDTNLADYQVQTLADGFRIVGGFDAFDGDQGSMHISYEVTDSAAGGVDGLGLRFDGAAVGKGSGTMVTDNAFGASNNQVVSANVFSSGGGGAQLLNTASFSGPQTDLHVEEGILLKSVGLASGVAVSAVDDHFTAMPEPGTLFLLSAGMAGLFVMARKREN
jgi:PEP-CTERM motif-containing protein